MGLRAVSSVRTLETAKSALWRMYYLNNPTSELGSYSSYRIK